LLADDVFRRLCWAREFMHAQQGDVVRLADAARSAGMSRYHFLRLFREAFGATPHAYLTRIRVERAKALLAADNASVTKICFDVGFESLGSFSTLFAERAGCAPSAWRRRFFQVSAELDRPAALVIPWCFFDHHGNPPDGSPIRNFEEARARADMASSGAEESS
jgi:AraC-like DNA-binding protein